MQQQLAFKITGYLIAPHEWFRIAAYKLIGKRYRYHLGDHRVVSDDVLTVNQQRFCLWLPIVVGFGLVFAVAAVWMISEIEGNYPHQLPDYLWAAPLWHHLLHLTWLTILVYTSIFSCYDLFFANPSRQQVS